MRVLGQVITTVITTGLAVWCFIPNVLLVATALMAVNDNQFHPYWELARAVVSQLAFMVLGYVAIDNIRLLYRTLVRRDIDANSKRV